MRTLRRAHSRSVSEVRNVDEERCRSKKACADGARACLQQAAELQSWPFERITQIVLEMRLGIGPRLGEACKKFFRTAGVTTTRIDWRSAEIGGAAGGWPRRPPSEMIISTSSNFLGERSGGSLTARSALFYRPPLRPWVE